MNDKQPNPGSPEAVEKGCKCPVLDNNNGRGLVVGDGPPMFWRLASCPLHGDGDKWKEKL